MAQPGVYIIQSQKNRSYYIGCTENLEQRLEHHNNGKVKATKNLIPWELKFFQICSNIKTARIVEYKLKKLKRRDYLDKIIQTQKIIGEIAKIL